MGVWLSGVVAAPSPNLFGRMSRLSLAPAPGWARSIRLPSLPRRLLSFASKSPFLIIGISGAVLDLLLRLLHFFIEFLLLLHYQLGLFWEMFHILGDYHFLLSGRPGRRELPEPGLRSLCHGYWHYSRSRWNASYGGLIQLSWRRDDRRFLH